jgi:hypothetical protein
MVERDAGAHMFRRLLPVVLMFSVASLAEAATVTSANLIQNGSFEELPAGMSLSGSNWSVYTSLPGWEVDTVEVQQGSVITPFDGLRYVELDSHGFNSNGTISQSFATLVGQEYLFRFAYAPRPEVVSESNSIIVSWGASDAPLSVLLDGLSQSNIGLSSARWRLFEFAFVASSDISFVQFAAAGRADTRGGFIDGVSVSALLATPNGTPEVPLPAAVWLFGSALVGVTGIARRRGGSIRTS